MRNKGGFLTQQAIGYSTPLHSGVVHINLITVGCDAPLVLRSFEMDCQASISWPSDPQQAIPRQLQSAIYVQQVFGFHVDAKELSASSPKGVLYLQFWYCPQCSLCSTYTLYIANVQELWHYVLAWPDRKVHQSWSMEAHFTSALCSSLFGTMQWQWNWEGLRLPRKPKVTKYKALGSLGEASAPAAGEILSINCRAWRLPTFGGMLFVLKPALSSPPRAPILPCSQYHWKALNNSSQDRICTAAIRIAV